MTWTRSQPLIDRAVSVSYLAWLLMITALYGQVIRQQLVIGAIFHLGKSVWDWRWLTFFGGACFALALLSILARGRWVILISGAVGLAVVVTTLIAGRFIVPVIVFVWLVLLAWAVGGRLLGSIVRKGQGDSLETSVFSIGLGFGVYSFLVLILATLGILYPTVAYAGLLVTSLLLRRDLLAITQSLWNGLVSVSKWSNSRFFNLLLAFSSLPLLMGYVGALAPEIQYDALNYHLTVPRIYIEQHRLIELPYFFHSYFAHSIEMTFALGLLLVDQTVAKLFHFAFGILTAAGIVAWARRHLQDTEIGLLGAILFYSTPLVTWLSTTAYIDLAVTFYVFSSIYGLLNWWTTSKRGWLIVSGCMAGLAMAAKLNSVLVLGPLAILILLRDSARQRRAIKRKGMNLLLFGLTLALIAAPWFLVTLLWTGNPVFPFFNAVFRSPEWAIENTFLNFGDFGLGRGVKELLLLPWNLTLHTNAFGEATPKGALGTTLLLALPFCLLQIGRQRRGFLALLLFIVTTFALGWFAVSQYARYFLPVFPIFALLASLTFFSTIRPTPATSTTSAFPSLLSGVAKILILVSLFLTRPVSVMQTWNIPERLPYKVAFGVESPDHFLSRILPVYDALEFLNDTSDPQQTKVLSVCNEFRFYSEAPMEVVWSTGPAGEVGSFKPGGVLAKFLRDNGFTHILVERNAIPESLTGLPVLDAQFLQRYTQLEFSRHNVHLYKLLGPEEFPRLSPGTAEQLLDNAGFEAVQDGVVQGWYFYGEPMADTSGRFSHSGRAAVRADNTSGYFQRLPIKEGEMYTLGHYTRALESGQRARLQINWLDDQLRIVDVSIDVVPVGIEWEWHEMSLVAPPGAVVAQVYASVHETGSVWFDDFQLVRGSEVFRDKYGPLFPLYKTYASVPIQFLGYTIAQRTHYPGDTMRLALHWKALRNLDENYSVFVHLLDKDHRLWGQGDEVYPTMNWTVGELISSQHKVAIPPNAPSGRYYIEVGIYTMDDMQRFTFLDENLDPLETTKLGPIKVVGGEARLSIEALEVQYPARVNLGNQVTFLGYDLENKSLKPGDTLHLDLYWLGQKKMDRDYTVFVHLLDKEGHLVAQRDNQPQDGAYPTSIWDEGEIVKDEYALPVPSGFSAGEYKIEIGMYLLSTMERLGVVGEDSQAEKDRILLNEILIATEP